VELTSERELFCFGIWDADKTSDQQRPSRITLHTPYNYFAPPQLLDLQYEQNVSETAESSDNVIVYGIAE